MDSEPNFESYSRRELLEIYEVIDREAYPERFQKVKSLLGLSDAQEGSDEDAFIYEGDDLEIDPQIAEMNKARRIKEFFDSLEENDSSLMSSDYGSGDGGGTGDTGGE